MKEDLIQFIWRSKTLSSKKINTTSGEDLEVVQTGTQNTNQGPDFLFAKIKINGMLWVGHVEIHLKSSDWEIHKHQQDPNYQNTILHVVWEHDKEIAWSGRIIPCIELKGFIDAEVLRKYQLLMENHQVIPCQHFLDCISSVAKITQIERLMVERMEEKTEKFKIELSAMQWNWEAMLYQKIAHYMVAPVNCDAMDKLCFKLPYSLVSKLIHDPFQLSALFLGTAGFLEDAKDDYTISLLQEFTFFRAKYKIHSMEAFEWKLLRLRPSHFPGLRIAQLTSFLTKKPKLFSAILEANTISDLYDLLDGNPNDYWKDHYTFGKISRNSKNPTIGKLTKEIVIINAICPLLFAYGTIYQMDIIMDKAINYLQKIKPESNHISLMWKNFKFAFEHAGHSQGGIQLYHRYCMEKKCTSCSIGNEILKIP